MENTKLDKILTFITIIIIIIFILVSILIVINKSKLPIVPASYNNNNDGTYTIKTITMNAGDTLTVETNTFNGLEKYYKDMKDFGSKKSDTFELYIINENRENVVIIEDNVFKATNSGYTTVASNLYKKGKNNNGERVIFKANVIIAEIYVINEESMIPITTAEDLANMRNDLDGHYILKADIDLAKWGDWEPIGNNPYNHSRGFSGMFVNPNGYKIKKLTITSSKTISSTFVGLFGQLNYRAYIDGIILDDISIDVSDYDDLYIVASPRVGGIAGYAQPQVIISNCVVDGKIIGGGERTGGIVGENNCGIISNCSFNGIIKAFNNHGIGIFSVGGITGHNNHTHRSTNEGMEIIENIIDCKVYADIESSAIAGGIIGYTNFKGAVKNSSFTGTVIGKYAGTMIGLEASGSDGPINLR